MYGGVPGSYIKMIVQVRVLAVKLLGILIVKLYLRLSGAVVIWSG